MSRTMLNDSQLSDKFWGHTVHTSVHILNRGLLRNDNDKTPYELWTGRPANVKHFRIFGSQCYIKRDDGKIRKFDSRVDEGIFVGYSSKRKAYCWRGRQLPQLVIINYILVMSINKWIVGGGLTAPTTFTFV